MRAANVSSIFRDDFALAKGDGGKAKKPASAEYMRTVLLKPRLMKAALELLRASAGASEATDVVFLDVDIALGNGDLSGWLFSAQRASAADVQMSHNW